MELEELKAQWAQYDKKLTQNLKFNEEILRKMNLDNSKKAMNTPLIYEIISSVTSVLVLLYLVKVVYRFSGDIAFLLPGIVSLAVVSVWLFFSIIKIKLLSNLNFYNSSIMELQKSVNGFEQMYLLSKKIELYSAPIFFVASYPILAMSLYGLNLYDHSIRFLIMIVSSLIFFYPLAIWFYKNIFDKKIQNTNAFLEELIKYEKEE